MRRAFTRALVWLTAAISVSAAAFAGTIPAGFLSFDLTSPPSMAQFDITNQTGPNSSTYPDTTWPVTNSISLSGLSLTVNFLTGSPQVFGSGFFSLEPDGLFYTGPSVTYGGSNPATSATLTGIFDTTTFNLNDGTTATVLASFSTTITDTTGVLQDGDFAVIYASTSTTTTPEPGTWVLLATSAAGLLLLFRRRVMFGDSAPPA